MPPFIVISGVFLKFLECSSSLILPLLTTEPHLDQPFLEIRRLLQSRPMNATVANQGAMVESFGLHQIKTSPTKAEEDVDNVRAHTHHTKPSMKKSGYGNGTSSRLSNDNSK